MSKSIHTVDLDFAAEWTVGDGFLSDDEYADFLARSATRLAERPAAGRWVLALRDEAGRTDVLLSALVAAGKPLDI